MDDEEATRALANAVGPFCDWAGLLNWLGLTEKDSLGLVSDGQLLNVRTLEGDVLFPSSQLGPNGELVARLREVLKVLRGSLDEWSIALWIVNKDIQDGVSNLERLQPAKLRP
ncbi:hypothetical protein [Cryobacterium zhongshanensis]|uniref:Uncharacterized protein n=1 Tax=Cryobacterium zhongshanensis TaxID=2928153 RepID=A0AA41QTS0_9MICO|nr:hypothetical protein [Cryobacterium zhongshanensis]MCI4657329.1 hypothetical protein [Cryobacterium zhongshanensis]